ncbi:CG0192-related protein [Plantactinospora sp. CA-294935]|uniref:CG0192-related protein n=1 Tax=Plantactinospora sp. CA-294935 TaxID=3240012 RepID=UPI003D91B84A
MALLHRAQLHPGKLELLADWLPGRRWYQGSAPAHVVRVASFRFDDPDGAVGIETMLVRSGDGPVHQVPLSYRAGSLPGGDDWLIGTTEHSVLGRRWVYDACGDPVYASALAGAIVTGSGQAEEFFEVDGVREFREPSMTVTGSGTPGSTVPSVHVIRRVVEDDGRTTIVTDAVELAVARRPGAGDDGLTGGTPIGGTLTATWPGQPTPLPLAYTVPR